MALTEASIREILPGLEALTERTRERLAAVTDWNEAQRVIAELEAAQWAGSPLVHDVGCLNRRIYRQFRPRSVRQRFEVGSRSTDVIQSSPSFRRNPWAS